MNSQESINGSESVSIEDIRQYITKQEKTMASLINSASNLVKPMNKLANAFSELKEGFLALGHMDIKDARNEESYLTTHHLQLFASTLSKVN